MPPLRRRRRARWLLSAWFALAASAWPVAASAQRSEASFAAASAAFAAGDYVRALSSFQALRAAGQDSAALRYNIGVCQYRVRDYAQAEATFAALAEAFPAMGAAAEYNRGLALLALERDEEARRAFERAAAGGDERLAALAAAALAEIRGGSAQQPVPVAAARSWSGYTSFRLGHDDNVALVDDPIVLLGESASSPLVEALGYAARRFDDVPLRLDFSGYVVRYPDAQAFDQDSWRVAAAFEHRGADWRLSGGPQVTYATLDGEGFERAAGIALQAVRPLGAQSAFDFRLLYDDLAAPSARYEYLEGSRVRLRFGVERRPAEAARLRFTYEHEVQDRAAANASPKRDRLTFGYSRRVSPNWSLEGLLAVRHGRYDELATPRTEDLVEATLSARRDLPTQWQLETELRWADNDASVAAYSYRSRRVGIGLSRGF
jgi:hypothetical protein